MPRALWASLTAALSRADNLEEGHFAERLWAALLSAPLPGSAATQLRRAADCEIARDRFGLKGTLQHCVCARAGE